MEAKDALVTVNVSGVALLKFRECRLAPGAVRPGVGAGGGDVCGSCLLASEHSCPPEFVCRNLGWGGVWGWGLLGGG